MRYALVINKLVLTIVESDETPSYPGADVVANPPPAVSSGWRYDGGQWSAPMVERRITQLALKRRWPRSKWRAMLAARTTNEDIADFQDSLTLARFVDLDDAETQFGINALAASSVPASYRLTAAEADAILTTPVAEHERP